MCTLNRANFPFLPPGPGGHLQSSLALICPQDTCSWPRTQCQIPQDRHSCPSEDVLPQPHYHAAPLGPAEPGLTCGLVSWSGLTLSVSPWRCPTPGAGAAPDPPAALLPGWDGGTYHSQTARLRFPWLPALGEHLAHNVPWHK